MEAESRQMVKGAVGGGKGSCCPTEIKLYFARRALEVCCAMQSLSLTAQCRASTLVKRADLRLSSEQGDPGNLGGEGAHHRVCDDGVTAVFCSPGPQHGFTNHVQLFCVMYGIVESPRGAFETYKEIGAPLWVSPYRWGK